MFAMNVAFDAGMVLNNKQINLNRDQTFNRYIKINMIFEKCPFHGHLKCF